MPQCNLVSNEMAINLDMFGALMKKGIGRDMKGCLTVSEQTAHNVKCRETRATPLNISIHNTLQSWLDIQLWLANNRPYAAS